MHSGISSAAILPAVVQMPRQVANPLPLLSELATGRDSGAGIGRFGPLGLKIAERQRFGGSRRISILSVAADGIAEGKSVGDL
jgi:hypothetical protein